jgi:hypothetical protein
MTSKFEESIKKDQAQDNKQNAPPHVHPFWMETSAQFAANFEPPDYLIEELLQRGNIYALTGMTGHGKTTVALLWAAHVALGLDLDDKEVEKGKVLFFAGENPTDIRMRWIKLCEEMKQEPNEVNVIFAPGAKTIADNDVRKRIDDEAAIHGPFSLIVVDTSAAYFKGDDENSNVQAGAHARMLRSLYKLPGNPTVLVTCHPIKNADLNNLLPRGGGAFLAEIDGNLTCIKDNMTVTVHWHGKFRGPEFAPMYFQLKSGTTEKLKTKKGKLIWTVTASTMSDNEASEMKDINRRKQDQVLAVMQRHIGTNLSLADIADKLQWIMLNGKPNKGLVNRTLKALEDEKLIKKVRGIWELTAAGREAAIKARGPHQHQAPPKQAPPRPAPGDKTVFDA